MEYTCSIEVEMGESDKGIKLERQNGKEDQDVIVGFHIEMLSILYRLDSTKISIPKKKT